MAPRRRTGPPLELDHDEIRAAAWELGQIIYKTRTLLRERLDGFVVANKVSGLYSENKKAPVWSSEAASSASAFSQKIWAVLMDENSHLSTAERCAAARVVGVEFGHTLMRVDAALNHCARLDQARHEASNPHSRDEIFSLNEQLRVVDSYRPHPSPGEPSIARATNGSFRKLIPAELFLKAVNSTSILDIQRLVRRSMEDMSGWNPILDDPSFPGRPLGVHVKGAGLR